eukprot:s2978_g5.t1
MLLTPAACRSILAKDSVVAPLRCGLLLKRAEVLHQKWQHKDALDDCVAVLGIGLERPRALRIAAEACRALYLRESEDPELGGNVRTHWMDMALHYLEEASATSEDPVLQRRLRAWRREERERRSDSMLFCGWPSLVRGRVGFSEAELRDIWEALRKESKGVHAAAISKATFIRALRHFSGDIEDRQSAENAGAPRNWIRNANLLVNTTADRVLLTDPFHAEGCRVRHCRCPQRPEGRGAAVGFQCKEARRVCKGADYQA